MPSPTTDRLQGFSASVAVKAPVRAATTVNITLSAEQTIDGVAIVDGDRVLVKDQSTTSQNGIYVASTGSWTRAADFDGSRDAVTGTTVQVLAGSANASKWFNVTSAEPVTIGTASITFGQTYVSLTAVSAATETAGGIAEIATQAETNTGTNDTTIVTPKKLNDSKFNSLGKHLVPIMAASMTPRDTLGASRGLIATATNHIMVPTLDYDQTTSEPATFIIPWPKSADEGTATVRYLWTHSSGAGDVRWRIAAVGFGDNDLLDTTYGTLVNVVDTGLGAGRVHRSAESGAITIANLAEGDLVTFRIVRDAADVLDTLTADAQLIGVELYITTNTGTDA